MMIKTRESDKISSHGSAVKRKILIVQGDWEGGMSLLALDLMDAGHEVGKVLFCVPDMIYRLRGITIHPFRESIGRFDHWLRELVRRDGYDTLFLYNHHRPYNRIAWDLAKEMDLGCQVFELGLIRPNCVTVFGKNAVPLTSLATAWKQILKGGARPPAVSSPREISRARAPVKLLSFCGNFLLSRITSPLFPHFVDQRDMKLGHHLKHGAIYLWRFLKRAGDREYDVLFAGDWARSYYAVPLQVHCDTQITICSKFSSIEEFIETVIASFEKHAPPQSRLVFKVHPMDRGYRDYRGLIETNNRRIGGGRLFYLDRIHLPTLLSNAKGVITINSSVGISGLVHGSPVITLGEAVYNLPRLTFQGPLHDFWTSARMPSKRRVNQFIHLLLTTSQGRGTLSQRCFDVPGRSKIQWPPVFSRGFFQPHPVSKKQPS